MSERKFYPVALDVRGRRVFIAGGGAVAERKTRRLLECGASVVIVSPVVTPVLAALAAEKRVNWHERFARPSDVDGCALVFAATSDRTVNTAIVERARELDIPANVADSPEDCDFIVPALIERGDVSVAIFTGATAPAMGRWMREQLEPLVGSEVADLARIVSTCRQQAMTLTTSQSLRSCALNGVLESQVLKVLKQDGFDAALAYAREILVQVIETAPGE